MAITARRVYEYLAGTEFRLRGLAAASTTFYRGQLLCINSATGALTTPSDAANLRPVGFYTGHGIDPGDDSLVTGSSGMPEIEALTGLLWIPFASAAQTDVGDWFYFADNGTVTKTAGSKTWAVQCLGYRAGYVLLDCRTAFPVTALA